MEHIQGNLDTLRSAVEYLYNHDSEVLMNSGYSGYTIGTSWCAETDKTEFCLRVKLEFDGDIFNVNLWSRGKKSIGGNIIGDRKFFNKEGSKYRLNTVYLPTIRHNKLVWLLEQAVEHLKNRSIVWDEAV